MESLHVYIPNYKETIPTKFHNLDHTSKSISMIYIALLFHFFLPLLYINFWFFFSSETMLCIFFVLLFQYDSFLNTVVLINYAHLIYSHQFINTSFRMLHLYADSNGTICLNFTFNSFNPLFLRILFLNIKEILLLILSSSTNHRFKT